MKAPFNIRINRLVTDPAFIRLANLSNEPNIFKIVGQSRYERWHSAFWGWLLDPSGSHGLGEYVLNRLLVLLFTFDVIRPNSAESLQSKVLSRISLNNISVRPNENDHTEVSVDAGRFDIFISGELVHHDNTHIDLNLVIELKVDSKTRAVQSRAYADWLYDNHPDDVNLLVYFLPNRELLKTPEGTVGDSRWFCVGFQSLHDEILLPILEHHGLSGKVKPFVSQYIDNLRIPYKGNKMAITEEERNLARALYEEYIDVFDTISEALQDVGVEIDLEDIKSKSSGRGSGRISVSINGQEFEGNSVPELFGVCLRYLVDSGIVKKIPLPWGTGTKRYIIAKGPDPTHPSGREFFAPVEYKGYILESHMDRQRSVSVLSDLCSYLDLEFKLIEV